jgi:hypothetical protein
MDPSLLRQTDVDDGTVNLHSSPKLRRKASNPQLNQWEQEKIPLVKTRRESRRQKNKREKKETHDGVYSDNEEFDGGYDTT